MKLFKMLTLPLKETIIGLVPLVCAAGAFAVEFDGTGDWPTSGDVVIPANTTITVDDAHIAAVAGWDTLKVGDGDEDEFEVHGVNRWLNEGE